MAYNRHRSAKRFGEGFGESWRAPSTGLVLVLSTACGEGGRLGSGDEVLDVSTVCHKSSKPRNWSHRNGNQRIDPNSPVLHRLQVLDPVIERA